MFDLPIHPIIVHFPIALSFIIPLILVLVFIGTKKDLFTSKVLIIPLLLQLIVVGSGYLAMEFGEDDEEKVEKVVAEQHIEEHEEAAEFFIYSQSVVLALLLAALFLQSVGILKPLALIASVLAIYPTILTGHSGGKLVYQYGAASAHATNANGSQVNPSNEGDNTEDRD